MLGAMSSTPPGGEQTVARWRLRLFVSGESSKNFAAIRNINAICERYIAGDFEFEVIDIDADPSFAETEQLLALPMLLRLDPPPPRRIIGDLSDPEATAVALNLKALSRA